MMKDLIPYFSDQCPKLYSGLHKFSDRLLKSYLSCTGSCHKSGPNDIVGESGEPEAITLF